MLEMLKKYTNRIEEESFGYITNPEKQAIVFNIEGLREFLQNELEWEILNDYNFDERYEDWDEDYDTAMEKLWEKMDWGDIEESVYNYTYLQVYFIEMEGTYYCIGDIEEIRYYDQIREYAIWQAEE